MSFSYRSSPWEIVSQGFFISSNYLIIIEKLPEGMCSGRKNKLLVSSQKTFFSYSPSGGIRIMILNKKTDLVVWKIIPTFELLNLKIKVMGIKLLIEQFLEKFCVVVPENEDSATIELYMDDHDCIEYENVQYYVPENNSSYTEEDEILREMILNTYSL